MKSSRREFIAGAGSMVAASAVQGVAAANEQKKPGKIVFISSVVGFFTTEFSGAYSASKHAIEAVAEALHAELKPFGIKVATINPGPHRTGFNDRMMETHRQWYDPNQHLIDHSKLAFHPRPVRPECGYRPHGGDRRAERRKVQERRSGSVRRRGQAVPGQCLGRDPVNLGVHLFFVPRTFTSTKRTLP